jgi:thiamine pyrophosphokinase
MKQAVILCNGNPPSAQLFSEVRSGADLFIAADGGGNVALEFGADPDVVIGDMDSFTPDKDYPFEVIEQPDQQTNDLEKALALAYNRQATHINILGATGSRLDHTLKNLSVLKQFDNEFDELLLKDNFGDIYLLPQTYSAHIPIGTPISLFPLSGNVSGISTKGLKYPITQGSLENGVRDGSSNEVISNPVSISYQSGDLLIFIAR